jgi:hypothetical protein
MKSRDIAPSWSLLVDPRFGTSRRILVIVAVSGSTFGLFGGAAGILLGLFAPAVATGLYALDGPEPPPSFSPVLFGLKTGTGLGLAWGVGGGLLVAAVALFFPRLVRFRLRSLMVWVALLAIVLGLARIAGFIRSSGRIP